MTQTTNPVPRLLSVQVGLPRELGYPEATDPLDRPWTTSFDKQPVNGPVQLRFTNLEGDGQADLVHHGGRDKAVLAYSADHYEGWRQELAIPDMPFGGFGENLTVAGLTEADVCLGDIWQIGETILQVSQPRQPCWKLARRWRIKTLTLRVQETGRSGWYFRVLQEGFVAAGQPIHRLDRPHPDWTVTRANQVMHFKKDDMNLAAELAAVPTLSTSWKTTLRQRFEQGGSPDPAQRLFGAAEA